MHITNPLTQDEEDLCAACWTDMDPSDLIQYEHDVIDEQLAPAEGIRCSSCMDWAVEPIEPDPDDPSYAPVRMGGEWVQ